MKKILNLTLTLFIGLVFIGCATKNTNVAEEKQPVLETAVVEPAVDIPVVKNTETISFAPDSEHVKFLGRSFYNGNVLFMGYSSTGAEFNIKAKRLDVTFAGDNNTRGGKDNGSRARVAVFVNGERKLDEMLLKSKETFTVFDDDSEIEGLVQVIKISECSSSVAGIVEIITDKEGVISPSESKDFKIEFIGDSITCGYGIDDNNRNNHFKTSTEDNTKTYAYKTAKALDADYSMVSVSGWGIISGYTGNGVKNESSQLPKYYDRLGVGWSSVGGVNPANEMWDFSKFVPDVVVVNLGTNDASYTKGDKDKIEEYTSAYVEFLKLIREKNPEAHIIGALGIMGQDLCAAVSDAVNRYKEETGDLSVSVVKFDNQNMADGICADWHPSEKTNTKAAARLTKTITEIFAK